MAKIFMYLFFISLCGYLSSCKNAGNQTTQTGKETTEAGDEHAEEADQHEAASTVQLNNGQKWQANRETTQGIAAMQKLLDGFSSAPTIDDYRGLKEKLETEFKLIFERCTMTGDAHTQLHNYLLPLKEMIEKLDAGTPQACSNTLRQIRTHLSEYGNYFV